ncbi:hypothetical protein RAS12_04795 [Achromobacter seleniivolatilans]|uniref:Knr4/Smi1-like domain-containing protein n=1 Tax=Achromobacter seleniivolatilans TaxID=3047478 RepID=A0ABY9M3W2_9BURK|nr:hypothetical protein [Achromobacter sp. R39]WMD21698.1 hypothetical protein RAS12_04795 [Achromobacter sp. R39]
MTSQPQRFLDHLAAHGWTVLRTTPDSPAATPGNAHGYGAFLAAFTELHNANQTRWFLSAADHDGTADCAFPWYTLRDISLEAALDDAGRQAVLDFWQQHTPIYMSVAGEYEFLAIERDSGRIVHGIEPEFEDTRDVASSLAALFEDMIAGRATAGLLA